MGDSVAFFVCTIDPAAGVGYIGAAGDGDIRDQCSSLVPADGATLRLHAQPRQQVVVGVRLPASSRLTFHGVDITYSHGWQRGTQFIGGGVDVQTPQG